MNQKAKRKYDQLSNMIHIENVKCELKTVDKNLMEKFQLNPYSWTAGVISEKPNNIDKHGVSKHKLNVPTQAITQEERLQSNKQLDHTLTQVTLVPTEKYSIPQTASQEIGWMVNPQNLTRQTFSHGVKMNEITRFADDYYTMTKINPFKHKR